MKQNRSSNIIPFFSTLFFCLGLFLQLNGLENDYLLNLKRAEILFNEGLYFDAIPIYEQVNEHLNIEIVNQPDDFKANLRLKLARSYYEIGDFKQAIAILSTEENTHKIYQNNLLKGLSFRHLKKYEEALKCFAICLALSKDEDRAQLEILNLELGLSNYFLGNEDLTKYYFTKIPIESQAYNLSQLYLVRLEIVKNNFADAQKIIDAIHLNGENFLKYELAFLKGEIYFHLNDFLQSSLYYEQALPKQNSTKTPWFQEALYHLGWGYLNSAKTSLVKSIQQIYFDKAEEKFLTLITLEPNERNYLALSQYLISRYESTRENKWLQKAEELLTNKEIFTSREGKAHAVLLKAGANSDYSLKNWLYKQQIQDINMPKDLLAKSWYYRGLNDFEEALTFQNQNLFEEANQAFETAAFSFNQAFELFLEKDKALAIRALQYHAKANYNQNNITSQIKAFDILEHLIQRNWLQELDDPEEIFYLHGLIAFKLGKESKNLSLETSGIQSLNTQISNYPNGKTTDAATMLLATHYFMKDEFGLAKQYFLLLNDNFPTSSLAGDALFWAANASENLKEDSTITKNLRIKVYENYPESLYAAEAYFRTFSYKEYLQGDRQALKHLQLLNENFPQSIYVIHASYLLGLDQKRDRKSREGKSLRKKNLTAAIDAFQNAEITFDALYNSHQLADQDLENLTFIRYRSTLERALTNLQIGEESHGAKRKIYLQYAEEVFKNIIQDFQNKQNSLLKNDLQIERYLPILEEATFNLAHTYIIDDNDLLAEKILLEMLEKYQKSKISRGYFLSQVWYELGLISMRQNNFKLALHSLLQAEDTSKGKNILNTDQKLNILIQQSMCYKGLNQLDSAMLTLSNIINEDVVSSLRLKAMFLRAEIYEMQERYELAKKQLEALSKKGGDWSKKAKDKLDETYGYK